MRLLMTDASRSIGEQTAERQPTAVTRRRSMLVLRRRVVAAFDGGQVSSDARALLLKRTDEAIGLLDRRPST